MRPLRQGIQDYVDMRRAMGFIFGRQEKELLGFLDFMEKSKHKIIETDLAKKWAQGKKSAPDWRAAKRLSVLREFAVYWKTIEPRTEVWPKNLWPMRYERVAPHIYTDLEIQKILKACFLLKSEDGFRAQMFYTLFGLVAATGLRISEVINLTTEDVDLKRGIITIRRTKFNKTRALPIHKSTVARLKKYQLLRINHLGKSELPFFFVTDYRTRIRPEVVEWTFDKIALACGVRTRPRKGPRIHDLRHTFVVRTMEDWYRKNQDINVLLPILSTYVGHAQPESTYWYMTITPELMDLARERRDRRKEWVLK